VIYRFFVAIAHAPRMFSTLKQIPLIKIKKIKKADDLGSSRNHLSSFIYFTFNTKIFYLLHFRELGHDPLTRA